MSRLKRMPMAIAMLLTPFLVRSQQPIANINAGLKIEILDGEDGVNIIKKKTAVSPVVEVKDKNDLPIAGVAVVIGLGAAGVFDNGAHEATVMTNANGIATAPNFQPTGKGAVNIQVRASYQGQTATATIHQTNFSTVAAAQKAGRVPGSSSSSASSSAGSSLSSSAVSAGGAAGSAGGGMSGLAVAGIVAGGAAAAGVGAAYASGILGGNSGTTVTTPSCTSQLNSLESVLSSFGSCSTSQCLQTAGQNLLNALGQACSCFGGVGAPAGYQSLIQQVISELQHDGFNTSQYQACFQ